MWDIWVRKKLSSDSILKEKSDNSLESSRRILPPPPDVRKVVMESEQVQESAFRINIMNEIAQFRFNQACKRIITEEEKNEKLQKEMSGNIEVKLPIPVKQVISPENTTIIGDSIIGCFSNPDSKWLVQCFEKAVISTLVSRIEKQEISVNFRYVFFMIGKNQVFRAIRSHTYQEVKKLVSAVLQQNDMAKIFFGGVLPRPVNNALAKPRIKAFNRFLATSVKKLQRSFLRVFYLPVQLRFTAEHEFNILYKTNRIHLNEIGWMRLKAALLEEAGFIRNL